MEMMAMFSYQAQAQDQLSFTEGDTLKILNVDNPDWLHAELKGRDGVVPGNYVAYNLPIWFMDLTKVQALSFLMAKRGNTSSYQHPEGAFIVRPSEQNRNDVSISVRIRDVQHFKILRSDNKKEYFLWRSGPFFPSVTKLVDYYRRSSISTTENCMLRDIQPLRVSVDYDFEARVPEELTIRRNDIITVLDQSDPAYTKGQLERDGVTYRGLFPTNYVQPYN